jgi:hypothetical protein
MQSYSSRWDLSTIPDAELASEWGRRRSAKRTEPPTPKLLRACPHCGKPFGARDMRVHIPRCHKNKRRRG